MADGGQGGIWGPLEPARLSWDEDGSPRSARHDDIYFAPGRGVDETRFVFLDGINAPDVWQGHQRFTIAETGFGTGLNFLVTLHNWLATAPDDAQLDYISAEQHPMNPADITRSIDPYPELKALMEELVSQLPPPYPGFHQLHLAGGRVRLTLLYGEATAMLERADAKVNAWYLDGFAPSKNPDMWTPELFAQLARLSAPGARLATFTAAGAVRRALETAGFSVTRSPGFAGKRERITATMPGTATPRTFAPRRIGIIGAGIAGLCLADVFSKRGHKPVLIDATGGRLRETSGNPAALFSPKPALGYAPYDRFLAQSWIAASRYYDWLEADGFPVWLKPRGLTKIAKSETAAAHQARIAAAYNWPGWLSAEENALIFPEAGSLDTAGIARALAPDCELIKANVTRLLKDTSGWVLQTADGQDLQGFDAITLASGWALYDLLAELENPIIANRGQIEVLDCKCLDESISSLSFGHYLSAPVTLADGSHVRVAGASNRRYPDGPPDNWADTDMREREITLTAVQSALGDENNLTVSSSRVGMRATTHDHMPIAGAVPDPTALANLPKHPQKIRPHELQPTDFNENIYVLGGLGARGYMIAPLLAETLAAQMDSTPLPLDRDILDAISPARFPLTDRLKN